MYTRLKQKNYAKNIQKRFATLLFNSSGSNFESLLISLICGYGSPAGEDTRRGSPVDCIPSTDEAPTIGKSYLFSKIAVTPSQLCDLEALQDL